MMKTLLQTTLCVSSTICLWSAFLLAYDWQGIRQRRSLSVVLFIWGLAWALRAYGLVFGDTTLIYESILSPRLILAGIVAGISFLVWPITVLSAPKIKIGRLTMFWLPFILCVAIYYGAIALFDLKQFNLKSLADFWAHISYFSVWFRLILCACLFGYLLLTIRLIIRYITEYNKYIEDNYSEYQKYAITWMHSYLSGLATITVFFFINLCFASYTSFLCHNIVACIFLSWLTAKIMVYNTPYSSDRTDYIIPELIKPEGEDFNSKFSSYKQQVEMWLDNERPYLNANFSLKDVMTHFGLNRTYASKIFNDGFGKSFIIVIREHRIEYAKKLIQINPGISMSDVAHLCGYSTAQAFHKAFVYCNDGLTPGKYAGSLNS